MASLEISLLGPIQFLKDERPISEFESDKARALLAYLAVESDHPQRRETLIGLLWPDTSQDRARHNLRQTLSNVRRVIGDRSAVSPYLITSREEIQFNAEGDCWLDVSAFNALVAACESHRHALAEDCGECAGRLEKAAQLYRGRFLEQFFLEDSAEFEEWALLRREALHQRALASLSRLVAHYLKRGDLEAARRYAARQLELDPWREEAHRQLMRALALSGQRSAALRQFETCRNVLSQELGAEPSDETKQLYDQIRKGELRPTLEARPHPPTGALRELPVQSTPFIGRETELAEVVRLISNPECCLLTLVGPGGIGKTRLAVQSASNMRGAFADGITFVSLAPVASVDSIIPAITESLGLLFHGAGELKLQFLNYLSEKQMLIVLDNAEHLLAGSELFSEIIRNSPGVKLLVTSREQLNLSQEWIFEVGGLPVPADLDATGNEESSAIALFVQRARRARHGFTLEPNDREAVVRICRSVGGTPLAIELAAAWVRLLSCREIADQIDHGLDLLTTAMRDVPERHRSVKSMIDQSWQMLGPEEQGVMMRLSVFRGGFQREAAERVAGASLSTLASLVGKSLVKRVEGDRYDLHELVGQYARERLAETGKMGETHTSHLLYFLDLVCKAEPELHGPQQRSWSERLEADHDNIRTALDAGLELAVEEVGATAAGGPTSRESLILAAALLPFWKRRGHWSEGRYWLNRVLVESGNVTGSKERAKAINAAVLLAVEQGDVSPAGRLSEENLALAGSLEDRDALASALSSHGYFLWKKKEFGPARQYCERALGLFRELDDKFGTAETMHYLGHITTNQGDLPAARKYLDDSALLYRQLGDSLGLCFSLTDIGIVAYLTDDFASAQEYLEESLSSAREIGNAIGITSALNALGDVARCGGDYEQAGKFYAEGLQLYKDMGDRDELPSMFHNLGYVELHRGELRRAAALFHNGLEMLAGSGNGGGIAECIEGMAAVAMAQSQPVRAARLLGASDGLRATFGAGLWPADRIEHESRMGTLKQMMDPETFSKAWDEGKRMTIDCAIAEALASTD